MALCVNLCGDSVLAPLNIVTIAASDKAGASSLIEQLVHWYDPVGADDEVNDLVRMSSNEVEPTSGSTNAAHRPPLPTVRSFEEYTFVASLDGRHTKHRHPAPSRNRQALSTSPSAATAPANAAVRVNVTEIGRPLRGELLGGSAVVPHHSGRMPVLSDGAESQASIGRTVGGGTAVTNTTQDWVSSASDSILQDRRAFVKKLQLCDAVLFVVDASELATVGNASLATNPTSRSDDSPAVCGAADPNKRVLPSNGASQNSRAIAEANVNNNDDLAAAVDDDDHEELDHTVEGHHHNQMQQSHQHSALSLPRESDHNVSPELILPNELSAGQVQLFLALRRCLAEMVDGSGLQAPTASGVRSSEQLLNGSGGGASGSFGSGSSSIWSRRKVKYVKRKCYPLFYVVANKQDRPLSLSAEQVAIQLGLLAQSPSAQSSRGADRSFGETAQPNAILKFEWLCEPTIALARNRGDIARYGCTKLVERVLLFREALSATTAATLSGKYTSESSGNPATQGLHKANSGARLLRSHSDGTVSPDPEYYPRHREVHQADVLPSPLASVGPYLLAGEDPLANESICSVGAAGDSTPYSPPAAAEGRLLASTKPPSSIRRKAMGSAKRR